MHINLHTFQSSLEVLNISLYFRVTGQLIAREIGIVRRVAVVISKRKTFIDFLGSDCVVSLFTEQIAAEIIEAYSILSLSDYLIDIGFILLLVKDEKLPEGFFAHERSKVVNIALQFGVGVFLEEDFHFLAAVNNLEVITNVVVIDLCRVCESLRVDSRHYSFKNLPVSCLVVDPNQLRYF